MTRRRINPNKKKIAKNYRPFKRFYKKYNRETIKALEEAERFDYTKPTNFIRKWGNLKILTDYPSEIRFVNEARKKSKDGKRKQIFWWQ